MNALLNYVAVAMKRVGDADGAAEIAALVNAAGLVAPGATEMAAGPDELELRVEFRDELAYSIKAKSATTVTLTYTVDGKLVSYEKSLAKDEVFTVYAKAYDFIDGMTVATSTGSTTVSLEGYYNALTDASNREMVSAIYSYAYAAKAYKAN